MDVHANRYLQIGQLAAELGLNPRTIRYYEAIGLLPIPERSDAGYCVYTDADIERLRFIRKAKMIGLTLDEIAQIFKLRRGGALPCECVLGMLDQKIAAVDEQLRMLEMFRHELVVRREGSMRHAHAEAIVCGIIEAQEPVQSGESKP